MPDQEHDGDRDRPSTAAPERSALIRRLVAARAAAEKARRRGDPDAEAVALARIQVAKRALRDVGVDPA